MCALTDEDGYLLYFCKAGDGVADVQLIADIHKVVLRNVLCGSVTLWCCHCAK